MPTYRLATDDLAPRYLKGATVEVGNRTLWRNLCASVGKQSWEVSIPVEVGGPGCHWLEKSWPEPVEVAVELGPAPVLEPADPDQEQAYRTELAEAQGRLTAAQVGLREVEGKLSAAMARGRIVGLDQEGLTSRGLFVHHRKQWLEKLAAAKAEVVRLLVLLEPCAAGPSLPKTVLVAADAGGRPSVLSGEDFRTKLVRAAVAVCQWPGLADLVGVEGESERTPRYCYPPQAYEAWRALRDLLRAWACATGRSALSFRALVREEDVAALLGHAAQVVAAARNGKVAA